MKASVVTVLLVVCLLPLSCKKKEENSALNSKRGKGVAKLPDEIVRKLEALRKAGEPTTSAELQRWFETPPLATNAAPLYETAFAQLPAAGSAEFAILGAAVSNLPPRNAPMPKATLNTLAKFCNERAGLFDSLRAAAQVKDCRYPVHFSEDVSSTLLPHVGKIKWCCQELLVKSYWLTETGQTDKALEALCDLVAVFESLNRDTTMIAQLVRYACVPIWEKGVERLLNRRKLTEAQLDRLDQALRGVGFKQGFRRSISGERCSTIVFCQMPPDVFRKNFGAISMDEDGEIKWDFANTKRSPGQEFDIEGYRESATYAQDVLFALENFEILIKAAETPFPGALSVAKEFAANIPIAMTNRYLFTMLMMPALGKVVSRYTQAEAHLRVMSSALAIERMRLGNGGRLPENADDPAIQSALSGLTDPFDGKSIRYKRRAANSYVVYSIGPDEKDDGGTPIEGRPKDQKTYDLAFIVTR